jgi:transposase-like protein
MLHELKSLDDLYEAFPDEQAVVDHFRSVRWRNGAFCPYCKSKRVMHFSDRRTHKCSDCRQRFSIKVGTIFEDTKLPLLKWYAAIWLITSHKKGIASAQLARDLGLTQKTAWFVLHRLRYAARTKSFNRPLSGVVEVDESYFGGKDANRHKNKRGKAQKTVVLGLLERSGQIRARSVPNLSARTVRGRIMDNVAPGTAIMTDEHPSYTGIPTSYPVWSVNHSKGEYVRFAVHTNGIEGAWSLFKRQVYGIHHWISVKHLDSYLGEMCYRYSNREMDDGARVNDLLSQTEGRSPTRC